LWPGKVNQKYLGNIDVIPNLYNGSVQLTFKLLSVDPENYDDAPSEGIRRLLELVKGETVSRNERYDTSLIGMGVLHFPHQLMGTQSRFEWEQL
jgi:hypothetical protein